LTRFHALSSCTIDNKKTNTRCSVARKPGPAAKYAEKINLSVIYSTPVQAIAGLRVLYYKITLVPIREMRDVMRITKKQMELTRDTWVRVRNGLYKGDLAQVVDVDHVRNQATLKLIPRIDLQEIARRMVSLCSVKVFNFPLSLCHVRLFLGMFVADVSPRAVLLMIDRESLAL
jgi:hypothetical protein